MTDETEEHESHGADTYSFEPRARNVEDERCCGGVERHSGETAF